MVIPWQHFRHIVLDDATGQTFGNRGLAYTGITHQQRVVLGAAAQNLDGALNLMLTANQRINLARRPSR
jgi:hypothetical protein